MDTYEKCCTIRRLIVNRAAEVMVYNWDSKFVLKHIKEFPKQLKEMEGGKDLFDIDPSELTSTQLDSLGFGLWSSETSMRLIPLWLYPFLTEGFEVECIDGTRLPFEKKNIDTDNRFGCLAYGVIPSDIVKQKER